MHTSTAEPIVKSLDIRFRDMRISSVPLGIAVLFAAKTNIDVYCVLYSKEINVSAITNEVANVNLADAKLFMAIGKNGSLKIQAVENGNKIPGHWFVSGKNFYLGYHKKSDPTPRDSYICEFGAVEEGDTPCESQEIPAGNIITPLT